MPIKHHLAAVLLIFVSSISYAGNIDLTSFISLINTDFREKKFQVAVKPYSSNIEIEKIESGSNVFNLYKFRTEGLMINVYNDRVLSVVAYKEGEKGNRQFNGKMPFNVNFTMNRSQIEKIIGPPTECIGATTINNVKIDLNCAYSYAPDIEFRITYDSLNPLDYQTKPSVMSFGSKILRVK